MFLSDQQDCTIFTMLRGLSSTAAPAAPASQAETGAMTSEQKKQAKDAKRQRKIMEASADARYAPVGTSNSLKDTWKGTMKTST